MASARYKKENITTATFNINFSRLFEAARNENFIGNAQNDLAAYVLAYAQKIAENYRPSHADFDSDDVAERAAITFLRYAKKKEIKAPSAYLYRVTASAFKRLDEKLHVEQPESDFLATSDSKGSWRAHVTKGCLSKHADLTALSPDDQYAIDSGLKEKGFEPSLQYYFDKALARLDERGRILAEMYYQGKVEKYGEEVGEVTGLAQGTIKSATFSMKRQMRIELEKIRDKLKSKGFNRDAEVVDETIDMLHKIEAIRYSGTAR